MRKIILATAILAIIGCSNQKPENHVYTNPAGKDFPIMAWFTLYGQHLDASNIDDLEACGFNLAFSFLTDMEEVDRVLDQACGTGVKVIVNCKELKENPIEAVRHLKDNPAVAGYFFRDEPSAKDFPDLHEWAQKLREADDSKLLYMNLHPSWAPEQFTGTPSYEEYVSRFVDEVPLGWMSFDHYPVLENGIRPDFYYNLEVVRRETTRKGIPFWAFALSTGHGPYPTATYESMCFQVYTDLAYGAQGIEYFTFQPGQNKSCIFHDAPIDENGNRTPTFDMVARINSEIKALTPVFLGCKVSDVSFTGDNLPKGTKALESLPAQIESLDCSGEGVLVSQLSNGRKQYLLLVNRSHTQEQTVTLDFKSKTTRILPDGTKEKSSRGTRTDTMGAGNMLLYRVK